MQLKKMHGYAQLAGEDQVKSLTFKLKPYISAT
jgi:hypothetical protein